MSEQSIVANVSLMYRHGVGIMRVEASLFQEKPVYHCPTGRYPDSGVRYGQSMLCITLDGSTLESLADTFKLNRPQVMVARTSVFL